LQGNVVKKYKETHPWIDFSLDTRRANIRTWLLLGEAQSKCFHIAGALLDPKTAKELHGMYLAKGALATTAIEGNTLSEEQVRRHLEGTLTLPESKAYLQTEVDNIIRACNDIAESHYNGENAQLNVEEIKNYNMRVLAGLPLKEDVQPGRLRLHSVGVGGYRGAPAEDCLYLLEKMCAMINGDFSLGPRWGIASGLLKAILSHLYIAWIHPFGDGNGRTARLVEFKLCITVGVPSPAAQLLSNHYNETRSDYYLKLDETSKRRDPFIFIDYALQGYVDQLEEQIRLIRQSQDAAFWTNFVHTRFKGMETAVDRRRRHFLLDLSEKTLPGYAYTPLADLAGISLRTARAYAVRSPRVLMRDVNELISMGLLERKGNGVRPNLALLSAYLPTRVDKK
jgi:Fic family protein